MATMNILHGIPHNSAIPLFVWRHVLFFLDLFNYFLQVIDGILVGDFFTILFCQYAVQLIFGVCIYHICVHNWITPISNINFNFHFNLFHNVVVKSPINSEERIQLYLFIWMRVTLHDHTTNHYWFPRVPSLFRHPHQPTHHNPLKRRQPCND